MRSTILTQQTKRSHPQACNYQQESKELWAYHHVRQMCAHNNFLRRARDDNVRRDNFLSSITCICALYYLIQYLLRLFLHSRHLGQTTIFRTATPRFFCPIHHHNDTIYWRHRRNIMKPTHFSGSKTVKRNSSAQRNVVKSVQCAINSSRAGKTFSWNNILDTSRAFLTFPPRDLSFPEVIIRDMSPAFARMFGTIPCSRVPLSTLLGRSTAREFQFQVEKAMLEGQAIMKYVNLHRADGAVLSCHVVVRSTPSGSRAQRAMLTKNQSDERYATITIRSASAIGNANFVGIGLLGVDRIPQQVLEKVIGSSSEATQTQRGGDELEDGELNIGDMEQFERISEEVISV